MTCAGNNTIAALMAGAVDGAAAARLEVHLDGCPACRELVARLGRGLSAIGEAPVRGLPQLGERIGRYEIRRVLGVGGMGVVYETRDTMLDRRVAVKLLRPELHGADLLAEALAMARLQHPNIVSVFDVGMADGQVYICMEYVDGMTLRAWTRGRSWREIVGIYVAAGEGLAYVHRANLVHLDFKPDNVLVDRDGRARVTDFGVARMLDVPARLLGGTPAYMPPEQRTGDADARSDQYAFCASLAEALDGRGPAWLQRAIARGMSAARADRYGSMQELLDALTPRRRRLGGLVVFAAATVAALAVAVPNRAASPSIGPRPTARIVDWSMPMAIPVPVEVERAAPAVGLEGRVVANQPSAPQHGPVSRRDFAPMFAMVSRAATRGPSVMQLPAYATASAASDHDEAEAPSMMTELGLCDDGSLRTCALEVPLCPPDTLVAVQGGCWTCADASTCAPLGLPRTCNDGTPLSCTRARPTCEGRDVAAVRDGCWSCEDPFTCSSRPVVVQPPSETCGNLVCERGESWQTCSRDCEPPRGSGGGSSAGSGSGSGSGWGSGSGSGSGCELTGSGACAAVCGNGFCEAGETHGSCANDCCELTGSGGCVPVCGNGFCEIGESCVADCSQTLTP